MTKALMEGLYEIRVEDLTADDLKAVRSLFLDYIGVTAAGAHTETAQVAARTLLKNRSEDRRQPLIGTDIWAGPVDAAFANAVAGHCLEFDDTHSGASLHPGVVVFSAALAASDLAGVSSNRFVEGVVTGYELMCRVGRAVDAEVLLRSIESGAVKKIWPVDILSPSTADRGRRRRLSTSATGTRCCTIST